ncbi:MAG TPA: gliding motility-associated C-terminal domain-containing protein [Flavobacteriales bacterium]|nr:gliding motility-associated C-terminal domain-containing protein [Flavobacteriales bacterium]
MAIRTACPAQCTGEVDLGPDTTLCTGQTLLLQAEAGFQSYLWDNGSTAEFRLVSAPGTYSCTVTDFGTSGELVVNGDFSAGSTGFTSDYVIGIGGTYGPLSDAGSYGVGTDPQTLHTNFSSCGDHTTGNGNMMVVNGAQIPGQNIWCQTVAVQANTDYAFSAWLASAFFESPAQLQFTVNGTPVGTGLDGTTVTCAWNNFYGIWASGSATSATICISNLNIFDSGNDFALDDISFAPFCTYSDEIEVTYQDYPDPSLGTDVEACADEPVTLSANWPGADTYEWQDGSNATTYSPTESGTYWVEVTTNGCMGRDSVEVEFLPLPEVELGQDQDRCEGDTIVLNAFNAGATYEWQDGSTDASYMVTESGNYTVTVDLAGCTTTDAVMFDFAPLPIVDLGNDTTICADTALFFDVERAGGTYLWQDGNTTAQNVTTAAGTYWVRVTENGCSTTDSLELGTIALPVADLGPDFLLCVGTTAELDATGAGYTYEWNDGSTEPTLSIDRPGQYGVVVTNSCGMAMDSIVVTQDFCDCPIYIPNAFTPGDDGFNDGFRPQFDCPQTGYAFRIFDRWGAELWASTDPTDSWKGDGGVPLGVYTWSLEIRPGTVNDHSPRKLTGHVVLIR